MHRVLSIQTKIYFNDSIKKSFYNFIWTNWFGKKLQKKINQFQNEIKEYNINKDKILNSIYDQTINYSSPKIDFEPLLLKPNNITPAHIYQILINNKKKLDSINFLIIQGLERGNLRVVLETIAHLRILFLYKLYRVRVRTLEFQYLFYFEES